MPWFPDFITAVELARRQTRAAGQADPVGQYLAALTHGDTHDLETVWPGEVVVHDPRAGEIRGHKELRRFVRQNRAWLAERHARIETVAATCVGRRAAVDGVRCAVEYNCVSWGSHDLPPQAGIAVYERGPDGLLAAARVYDDIEAPV
jgi:hypothetical protein